MTLRIALTEEQRTALAGLEWFISLKDKQRGRTQLMALATVREAVRNPGKSLHLIDHHPGEAGLEALRSAVLWTLQVYQMRNFATFSSTTVTIHQPDPTSADYPAFERGCVALLTL